MPTRCGLEAAGLGEAGCNADVRQFGSIVTVAPASVFPSFDCRSRRATPAKREWLVSYWLRLQIWTDFLRPSIARKRSFLAMSKSPSSSNEYGNLSENREPWHLSYRGIFAFGSHQQAVGRQRLARTPSGNSAAVTSTQSTCCCGPSCIPSSSAVTTSWNSAPSPAR